MRWTLHPLLLLLALIAASCAGSPSSEPESSARPSSGAPMAEVGDAPPESDFERELREGIARFDAKDLAGAELRIERALRIDPSSPEAWNALARVAYERGDMELCVERADRALRISPDHREARLNRGLALFGMRDYGAAHTEFRRIVAYPVEEGRISDYSLAYREWQTRRSEGEMDAPFPEAVDRGLLPVDREAMLARWYARLTAVLEKGPGFERKFVAETEHYRVVSDDSEDLANLIADRLERILVEYRKLLPPPDPRVLDRGFSVTVFSARDDYVRYLGEILDDPATAHISGGSYHPLLRELIIGKGAELGRTLLVLQHEGFHQYSYALLDRVPPWLGEGLADYFAPSRLAGGRFEVGEPHPLRLESLSKALSGAEPSDLRALLLADASEFMAAGESEIRARSATVGRNYALAWAFAHFLVEADGGAHLPLLRKYFRALHEGRTQAEAYRAVFAAGPLEKLTSSFDRHCREVLLPPSRSFFVASRARRRLG